jgi:hypothetical protein
LTATPDDQGHRLAGADILQNGLAQIGLKIGVCYRANLEYLIVGLKLCRDK